MKTIKVAEATVLLRCAGVDPLASGDAGKGSE